MLQYAVMFAICIVVPTAMTAVLIWFFKKLNRIEKERWGDKAAIQTEESPFTAIKRIFVKKSKN